MKKKLWIIIALVAALLIGGGVMLFGDNQTDAPAITPEAPAPTEAPVNLENLEYAIEYIRTYYKSTPKETPGDYSRFGTVRVGLDAFTVTWSVDVDEKYVKVVANADGSYLIDVNENSDKEVPYVLTATVTDAAGNSLTTTWEHILPGFDIAAMQDIVDQAYALADGQALEEPVTLRGVIISVDTPYDASYKNVTVTITVTGRDDKPIKCYRLKGDGADTLAIGDTITVTGIIKNYKGIIEFDTGCTLDSLVKGDNEAIKAPEDPAEIMKQAYALSPNKSLPYICTLTGTITSVDEAFSTQYNNITVTMLVKNGGGYSIKCYRLKGTDANTLNVNDIITVTGQITNYNGTIEFGAGCTLDSVTQKAPPTQPNDPHAVVDAAYKLASGKSLPYEATLTGKVTDIKYRWSEQYPTVSLNMVVEGRENKPLYCYSMVGNVADLKNVEIGDTVTVKGMIKNFYDSKAGTNTIEYDRPTLLKLVKNTAVAPSDPKQIVDEAFALKDGEVLPYKSTLTGKIVSIDEGYNSSFQNITVTIKVEGSDGMKNLKCYRLKGNGAADLEIGDTITVTGMIKNYKGTIEFDQGCTLDKVVKGEEEKPVAPSDPKQIVDEAFALERNETLPYEAQLTGKIVEINTPYDSGFQNITVTIEVEGSDGMKNLKCYRLKGNGAEDLKVGDEITVKGYITHYYNAEKDLSEIEFAAGCVLVTDSGSDDPVPPADAITPVAHKDVEEGTAYKYYMEQVSLGKTLYFNGKMSGEYLATTEKAAEAVDVYMEKAEGGVRFYFLDGETKTYLEVYLNDAGKPRPKVTTEPTEVYVYDEETGIYVIQIEDNNYYYGTYGNYTTMSTSSTYYITGDNAANAGVTQYICQFGIYNGEVEEPEQPEKPEVAVTPVAHKDVEEGTAYKYYMEQVSLGKTLYFNGKMSGEYLATTEKAAEAADVYMEKVEGGVRFYFQDGETKTYLEVYLNDAGKPRPKVTTEPTEVYVYDEETGIYVIQIEDNNYYYGTYGNYTTMSTSSTYYITGDNAANAGVTQYICQFGIYNGEVEEPEEPEQPDVPEVPETDVTPVAHKDVEEGTAYKFFVEQNNVKKVLYFNGELFGEYLATTQDPAEGVDVYMEKAEGGVRFYYMDGETKTYIEMYLNDAGKSRPKLSTEPTVVYTFDEESQLYVVELDGKLYYYGTYNTFETFSTSGTHYITGSNAANVGVTQFVAQFGTYGTEEDENVSGPYLFYVDQVNLNKTLYFNGQMSGDYLATTEDPAEAAEIYLAETEEGTLIYFLDGDVKNYIEIYLNSNKKPRHQIVTEPTMAYVYDEQTDLYVADLSGNKYYHGTYNQFATISASSTWYITGDNVVNVGKTQFVAQFKEVNQDPGCVHEIVHVDAVAPGCENDGNIEYWYCEVCELVWKDEALTQVITMDEVILLADHQNIIHMAYVAPGCHYEGHYEHWYCADCDIVWADEIRHQITNHKNVIIPAIGAEVVHISAVEPGCHMVGNIEYWVCYSCEQVWQDEALTQLTNIKNVVLPELGGEVIHVEAKEPTAEAEGNIEHWYCETCEQVWQDEALTQLTNHKNVIIPKLDVCLHENITHMEAVDAGCHMIGHIEHWYCNDCEAVWQDEALTQITNHKNVIIPELGGEVIHVEAVANGCEKEGNIEYWYCETCEQFWQDEARTQLTNSKNVILPAVHHDVIHMDAVEAACHMIGHVEHWYCANCDIVWLDEGQTQISNHKSVIIPAIGGDVIHVEAKDPTEIENGNIEHWYCETCEQVWQDEALTQLTNHKNVIIPKLEACLHENITHMEAVDAGCHMIGHVEHWYCVDCDIVWTDEGHTQISNHKSVIIPAVGGDVIHVEANEPTATENGNIEYWYCETCEQVWQDEALTQLTNHKNVILAATGEEEDDALDTPEEIVNAAYALEKGASLEGEFTLTGVITKIHTPYSAQYKNVSVIIEIEDVEDKPILCYRLKGDGADALLVGDTITVTGTLTNYNGTIEFVAGCILDEVVKGDNEAVEKPEDPKDIVDAAFALAEGDSLPYEATLSGYITKIKTPYDSGYKNITVIISVMGNDGEKELTCFRLKGDGAADLVEGDYITVTGVLMNYGGTIEFGSGCMLDSVE